MIEDYFRQLDALVTGSPVVHSSRITYDKRSSFVGFIRGNIYFLDSSVLQVRKFVNMEQGLERYMYAYHYQRANGTMEFRYDNTPHFPTLSTFPHHKHKADEQTGGSRSSRPRASSGRDPAFDRDFYLIHAPGQCHGRHRPPEARMTSVMSI